MRKEEKLEGTEREGKGELQGGYYPGRKRREGRGETDSDGGEPEGHGRVGCSRQGLLRGLIQQKLC